MENLYELFPVWLELLNQGVMLSANYLSGAAGPIGLLGYLPPLALTLISRQALHVLAALILCLATLAVLYLGDPAVGLAIYAGSYLVAAHAFVARAQRLQTDFVAAKLTRIEAEIITFLDALERRSRDADHQPPIQPLSPPSANERG